MVAAKKPCERGYPFQVGRGTTASVPLVRQGAHVRRRGMKARPPFGGFAFFSASQISHKTELMPVVRKSSAYVFAELGGDVEFPLRPNSSSFTGAPYQKYNASRMTHRLMLLVTQITTAATTPALANTPDTTAAAYRITPNAYAIRSSAHLITAMKRPNTQ